MVYKGEASRVPTFKERLDAFFGRAFRAVSEVDDFDFVAVIPRGMYGVESEDGHHVVVHMFPDPSKEFYLDITSIDEHENEWVITTPRQRWAFRRVPGEQANGFADALKAVGMDV